MNLLNCCIFMFKFWDDYLKDCSPQMLKMRKTLLRRLPWHSTRSKVSVKRFLLRNEIIEVMNYLLKLSILNFLNILFYVLFIFRDLVVLVRNSSGEAVSFLSQVIVTFLSEQRLHPEILKTLSTLGEMWINLSSSFPWR